MFGFIRWFSNCHPITTKAGFSSHMYVPFPPHHKRVWHSVLQLCNLISGCCVVASNLIEFCMHRLEILNHWLHYHKTTIQCCYASKWVPHVAHFLPTIIPRGILYVHVWCTLFWSWKLTSCCHHLYSMPGWRQNEEVTRWLCLLAGPFDWSCSAPTRSSVWRGYMYFWPLPAECSMHAGYLSLGSTNITTNNTEILITDIGEEQWLNGVAAHPVHKALGEHDNCLLHNHLPEIFQRIRQRTWVWHNDTVNVLTLSSNVLGVTVNSAFKSSTDNVWFPDL